MGQLDTCVLLKILDRLGDLGEISISCRGDELKFEIVRYTSNGRIGVSRSLALDDLRNAGDDLLYKTLDEVYEAMNQITER